MNHSLVIEGIVTAKMTLGLIFGAFQNLSSAVLLQVAVLTIGIELRPTTDTSSTCRKFELHCLVQTVLLVAVQSPLFI